MRIVVKKFGEILNSRPEGREAYLVARAYMRPATEADEFITGLRSEYGPRIRCLPSNNSSVTLSLQMLEKPA
jgi:exopolyphosphatase/pppGpp-phosphohydrolase